ncbi:hypothetical protein SAMN04489726_3081 [Allokutzneria albata]|uniref:Uncharacterized protein n=1 Tax=Allokutzneria albata TaxID=211114 RepID=A0A1G9VK57_ALLAB|nr:hypothetical protein SAMN04489726_3081 [Allokutzneria albata]
MIAVLALVTSVASLVWNMASWVTMGGSVMSVQSSPTASVSATPEREIRLSLFLLA